jgi:hypothetical protein
MAGDDESPARLPTTHRREERTVTEETIGGETLEVPDDYSNPVFPPTILVIDDPPEPGSEDSDESLDVDDVGEIDPYALGFEAGYAKGYYDSEKELAEEYDQGFGDGFDEAVDQYESREDTLTFSGADLIVLGLGFLALAIPLAVLVARKERTPWRLPLS